MTWPPHSGGGDLLQGRPRVGRRLLQPEFGDLSLGEHRLAREDGGAWLGQLPVSGLMAAHPAPA